MTKELNKSFSYFMLLCTYTFTDRDKVKRISINPKTDPIQQARQGRLL